MSITPQFFSFANVEFDESAQRLCVAGIEVALEPLPRSVLSAMLHREGGVVAKEALIERFWSDRITVDNVVANAISKLRRALGPAAASRIVTVPRAGYRLEGPVERRRAGDAARVPVVSSSNRLRRESRRAREHTASHIAVAPQEFLMWARTETPSLRGHIASDSALQVVQRHLANGGLTSREQVLALARLAQSTLESALREWRRLEAGVDAERASVPEHRDVTAPLH